MIALIGCSGSDQGKRTVTDDLGRNVHLPDSVQRIVSLAPSVTEVAFAAGVGDLLVGVTTADDYPPQVSSIRQISALPVDFETLALLQPDVVLATDQVNSTRDIRTFESMGLAVYFLHFDTLDSIFDRMRAVGELVGRTAIADREASRLERRLDSLRSIATSEARPSVLTLIGYDVLYSVGAGSYVHDMIEAAGGRSLTAGLESAAPVLSEEFVLSSRPDFIVGAFGSDFSVERLLERRPAWRSLPAVQNNRIINIQADYIHRPGPRVLDGIEYLQQSLRAAE
jgi:iron complex transport system substrate-binding protein